MRKLQQESARISEQRDALRMEVKAGKKREQDAETALASLKLDLRSRKAADGNKLAAASILSLDVLFPMLPLASFPPR